MIAKKIIIISCLLLMFASTAWARFGSSNMGVMGYPEPRCYQPNKPWGDDRWAWERFKSEVEEYEGCIRDYVDAAKNDQDEIADKANAAIREYNNFVNSLNW
jgi:hypothetical protein